MKRSRSYFSILFIALLAFTFSNCNDDDVSSRKQQITTIRLIVNNGGNSDEFKFVDTDGPGGIAPMIDDIELESGESYFVNVIFEDESSGEIVDVTQEISERSEEYMVCYHFPGLVSVSGQDTDSNGSPLGLFINISALEKGENILNLSLKQDPDKGADFPCETGNTDIRVTFPVIIN